MSPLTDRALEVAVEAAHHAGEVILRNLGGLAPDDIDAKQSNDFVTRVDRDSEELIVSTIRSAFPSHMFLAEEAHLDLLPEHGYRWIIDPLDGTKNFIHGYPVFAVSIGLEHEGEIIVAVVYDPVRRETFTARKGGGAHVNEVPLRVSPRAELSSCLIATGFPFRKHHVMDRYLDVFGRVLRASSDLRRAGAAAIDLAWVAAGRCDGFFEYGLSPWDVAAGSLLIQEAGGVVSDFEGAADYMKSGNIIAGNARIHAELLGYCRGVFQG